MADITVKLIWYKLSETVSKMAEAGAKMESWFSWEEHFLDVLLIGWISWAIFIVAVVNAMLTFFGPLQPRISWDKSRDGGQTSTTVAHGPQQPESTFWLNSALNWFYLHYNKFPDFIDAWVLALNEQVHKLGGPVQLRFEKIQSGSLPPKFGEVKYDAGPEDRLDIDCTVDSRDVSFAVFASQQTHEGVKLTNLTVNVLKLKGHLKIHCYREGKDMMAKVGFIGRPDVKVVGKPVNPYLDPEDMVDVGVTEEVIRNAICLASTTFNVSRWIESGGSEGPQIERQRSTDKEGRQLRGSAPTSPRGTQNQQQTFEPIEVKESAVQQQQQHSAFQAPSTATKSPPQRLQQTQLSSDKRLLTKVIKASGLKQGNSGSLDPYCVVSVDNPPQTETTNVVRSTLNPFWDEQFYFDLSPDSQEIRFEILDKKRPQNENFLGEALVYCEDLQKNPSSRQIIPLQGRLGAGEFVSGSITVEFLCMDVSQDLNVSNQVSPRRTIETIKSMTPGGTLVTTTTTTTQRQQNHRLDANVDSSPSYIQKLDFDYNDAEPHQGSSAFYRPIPTIESSPTDSSESHPVMSNPESPIITYPQPEQHQEPKDDIDIHRQKHESDTPNLKKSRSLGGSLKKLFRRSRKRSRSVGKGDQSRESSVSRQSRHLSEGPSREGSLTRTSHTSSHQETVVL